MQKHKQSDPLCLQYLELHSEIQPGEDEYECMYFDDKENDCKCNLCGGLYKKFYVTYIHDNKNNKKIKTKSCVFCNVVVNFKSAYMGKCFLVSSVLNQNEINSRILNDFDLNNTISTPLELDKSSQLIQLSIFEFVNAYELMSSDEKKLFENFKVMFTSNIVSLLQNKTTNYFSACKTETILVKKHDNTYFENTTYKFTPKQQKILDKYVKKYISSQLDKTHQIKSSIDAKCIDIINKVNFLNSLVL